MLFILLKLVSESLLSFYPAMVKFINFPVVNQLWGRLIVYALISMIFMNWGKVGGILFSWMGLILAGVNLFHIYSSYIGFNNLESGVSYSIFYTYPVFILLFSGLLKWIYLLPLVGVVLLTYGNWKDIKTNNNEEDAMEEEEEVDGKVEKVGKKFWIGILGIIGAMLSEVALYFIVKKMGNISKWNVLFVAYLLPAVILTLVLRRNVLPPRGGEHWVRNVVLMIVGNGIIGALGYYLRFYTIDKLSVFMYSGLSYFGIIMAYVYGWTINKEKVGWYSVVGSLLVIIGGLLVGKN